MSSTAFAACLLTLGFALCLCWVSIFLGMLVRESGAVQGLGLLFLFPLTFGSTTFVKAETMPGWLQAWVRVNPITHLNEAVRNLMVHGSDARGRHGPGHQSDGQWRLRPRPGSLGRRDDPGRRHPAVRGESRRAKPDHRHDPVRGVGPLVAAPHPAPAELSHGLGAIQGLAQDVGVTGVLRGFGDDMEQHPAC